MAYCIQVIKVTTDQSDDFWTLEESNGNRHLRVYSVNKRLSDGNVTLREINVPKTDDNYINLSWCRLSYDGNMNIFLCDWVSKDVHVLLVSGQCHSQLLLPHNFKNRPCILAVDKKRQVLCVGQDNCEVEALKVTNGDGSE